MPFPEMLRSTRVRRCLSCYAFKGSFKWDAKVGGDGNTYSFELVPGLGFDESFLGRCEVKPAKGASIVVTARLKPEIE